MSTASDNTSTRLYIARQTALACGLALVLAGLGSAGCGEEEPQGPPPTYPFELEVSVVDEGENGVAGAPVVIDGKTVGYTDREGLFEAVLHEREGAELELAVGEMEDYRAAGEASTSERLKLKESLEGNIVPVPVTMQTTMSSIRTDYLFWLEVECDEFLDEDDRCADLPVLLDGEERARTDARGTAHFLLEEVPEETVEVQIDTPEPPEDDDDDEDSFTIEPANPTYDIELGLDPEVIVIRERFTDPVAEEEANKPAPRPRPRPRPTPPPSNTDDSGSDSVEEDDDSGGDDDEDDIIELF